MGILDPCSSIRTLSTGNTTDPAAGNLASAPLRSLGRVGTLSRICAKIIVVSENGNLRLNRNGEGFRLSLLLIARKQDRNCKKYIPRIGNRNSPYANRVSTDY